METTEKRMLGQAIIQRLDLLLEQNQALLNLFTQDSSESIEKDLEQHEEEKMIENVKQRIKPKED